MIAVGYMAKYVASAPDAPGFEAVEDLYSVSPCLSAYFADYIGRWKHNGFWLFDSPELIGLVAAESGRDLEGTTLFYYEACGQEFDTSAGGWSSFDREASLTTAVSPPVNQTLHGYDVVSFSAGAGPECSPLSCNGLASRVEVDRHCLLASAGEARRLLESGLFADAEPGPYRIFAVHSVPWPGS